LSLHLRHWHYGWLAWSLHVGNAIIAIVHQYSLAFNHCYCAMVVGHYWLPLLLVAHGYVIGSHWSLPLVTAIGLFINITPGIGHSSLVIHHCRHWPSLRHYAIPISIYWSLA